MPIYPIRPLLKKVLLFFGDILEKEKIFGYILKKFYKT